METNQKYDNDPWWRIFFKKPPETLRPLVTELCKRLCNPEVEWIFNSEHGYCYNYGTQLWVYRKEKLNIQGMELDLSEYEKGQLWKAVEQARINFIRRNGLA